MKRTFIYIENITENKMKLLVPVETENDFTEITDLFQKYLAVARLTEPTKEFKGKIVSFTDEDLNLNIKELKLSPRLNSILKSLNKNTVLSLFDIKKLIAKGSKTNNQIGIKSELAIRVALYNFVKIYGEEQEGLPNIENKKIKEENNLDEIRTYQIIFLKDIDGNKYNVGWFSKNPNDDRPFDEFQNYLLEKAKTDSILTLKTITREFLMIKPSEIKKIYEGEIVTGKKKDIIEYFQKKYVYY